MAAKLKDIRQKLRQRLHASIGNTVKWLQSVVRGYFQYHAIPGNEKRLWAFRKDVLRLWLRQLRRRSQRSHWTQERFQERLGSLLPGIEILHPYPDVRFNAKHLVESASYYRRRLPHWRPEGAALFITWRLHGSLPADRSRASGDNPVDKIEHRENILPKSKGRLTTPAPDRCG